MSDNTESTQNSTKSASNDSKFIMGVYPLKELTPKEWKEYWKVHPKDYIRE